MTALHDDILKQANAFSQAFKENQAEICKQQSIHNDLQVQLTEEKIKFDEIVLEGNFLYRELCIMLDDCNKKRSNITKLNHEIKKMKKEFEMTRKHMVDKKNEYEAMNREIISYDLKMKSYKKGLSEAESKTPLMKQVAEMQNLVEALRTEYSEVKNTQTQMLTNDDGQLITKQNLFSSIRDIEQQIKSQKDEVLLKKAELEAVKEKRTGLEMKKFILKKRHSALLIRMKRELEDQKEKHSTFVMQKEYLTKMINSTKRKLEKYV